MTFQGPNNPSNIHFQNTSGTQEVADRLRQYPIGTTLNLGITYSASTFSVTASDGTALSSTNPGYVVLASKTNPGQKKIFTVTANQGFIDATGASEIIGNLFGLTTGRAAPEVIPFFLYAVSADDESTIAFMISRIPHRSQAPLVGAIGAPDDAVADTQGSFWSLDNIDETLYDENPCASLGSFRMTMSAADDWTVALMHNGDGIGNFHEYFDFAVNRGHFGAAANKYFYDNGGTAPDDSTGSYTYTISRNGVCHAGLDFENIDTAGLGAVQVDIANPYNSGVQKETIWHGRDFVGGVIGFVASVGTGNAGQLVFVNNNNSWARTNADYVATSQITMSATFHVYIGPL